MGDDAEKSLLAVNEASARARNMWLAFLGLLAYFFVALAGVEHENLLRNDAVNLPIINISLPLFGFFLFGPALLVLMHFGLLMQHVSLAEKLDAFNKLFKPSTPDEKPAGDKNSLGEQASAFRLRLHSYAITQFIAGPPASPVIKLGQWALGWLVLSALPLTVLLYFQIQFLAYHLSVMTWFHRLTILADLAVLVAVGTFIVSPASSFRDAFEKFLKGSQMRLVPIGIAVVFTGIFSLFIATIPDESMDVIMASRTPISVNADGRLNDRELKLAKNTRAGRNRRVFVLTACLFEAHRGCPEWLHLFDRNLNVSSKTLVPDGWKTNTPGLQLQGRDLKYARLDRSDLRGADLTGANLDYAWLRETKLQYAVLTRANLTGAVLWKANLQNVDAHSSNFFKAYLKRAKLQAADFRDSHFQAANLDGAKLQGARLWNAGLQKASLVDANLQATLLVCANLMGANLSDANLLAADLPGSLLYDANLDVADIRGADLNSAELWRTTPPTTNDFEGVYPPIRAITLPTQKTVTRLERIANKYKDNEKYGDIENLISDQIIEIISKIESNSFWNYSKDNEIWQEIIMKNKAKYYEIGLNQTHIQDPKLIDDTVKFLVDVACADGKPGYVANGIVERMEPYGLESKLGTRPYAPALARALIGELNNDQCPGMKEIHFSDLSELRVIARHEANGPSGSCFNEQ